MKLALRVALAVMVLGVPALGQDSTSLAPAIGDAIYPWYDAATGPYGSEQCNTFVVDLENFRSSWGNGFRIAPLIKASQVGYSTAYLNCLMSAQGMSNTMLPALGFAYSGYELWMGPGFGVNNNPARNTPPANPQNPVGPSLQFGVGFSEYGTSDWSTSISNIIGGVVNMDAYNALLPYAPDRLYVARIIGALNQTSGGVNEAAFGFGSVDSEGHLHFRADGYGASGNALQGQNYFRVAQQARNCAILNTISNAGGSDAAATAWLMQDLDPNNPTAITPNIIPSQIAGRPVLMGSDFYTRYVYEQIAGTVTKVTTHKDPAINDLRGSIGFSHLLTCEVGSVGTAGMIGLDASWLAHNINLWDVDVNGNVLSSSGFGYSIAVDPATDPAFTAIPFGPDARFYHYQSQVSYNGGNSQIAIGQDQDGRGLAAAIMYDMTADQMDPNNYLFGYNNPYNALAVGRFPCGDPASVQWAVAAYCTLTTAGDHTSWVGSNVTDAQGTVIATLCPMWDTTNADPTIFGSSYRGPSISAPAIDSVGNIYFLSALRFMPDLGDPNSFYDSSGLVRAVYRPDTFSYDLELIFKNHQKFTGQNSQVDYEISFLSLVDSNSINSGSLWSNNIMQEGFAAIDTSSMCPANPRTLGGLAINAEITYDVNADGTYDDEEYNVLMYLGGGYMLGDANCDGVLNALDIDPFVLGLSSGQAAWEASFTCDFFTACDINNDGLVNALDIDPFVGLLTGCQ